MTNDKIQVIGIDVGGTAIKLGRFTPDGTCLQSLSVAAPQPTTPEAVLAVLVGLLAHPMQGDALPKSPLTYLDGLMCL